MLKAKVSLRNHNLEFISSIFLSFIAGLLLSDIKISGTVSFLNISIAGAVNPLSSLAVLVGSLIKYVATSQLHKNIIIICSMVFIILCKLIFDINLSSRQTGIITAVSTFLSGLLVALIIDEIFFKVIFYLVYAIMAGFTASFINLTCDSLKHKKIIDLKSAVSCAYAIVYVVIIASFSSFDLFDLNIGRITGAAITLIALHHYSYIGGILCGALTICGLFLSSYETGLPFVLLPISGLLAGYLHKNNTAVISIFFISINFIFFIITGIFTDIFNFVFEIVISTLIFTAVSPLLSDKWIITEKSSKEINDIISQQMSFLASSIAVVRNDSKKISDYLSTINSSDDDCDTACQNVCRHCHNRLFCWYNNYDMTKSGFKKLTDMGEPKIEKFPYELEECIYKDKLALEFAKQYRKKLTARLIETKLSESRELLFEQIKITEDIIHSASQKVDIRYSESISKNVKEKLEKYNFYVSKVVAYYNSQNRLLLELYFSADDTPKNFERICDIISDEVKLKLDYSEPVYSGKEVRIRVFETTQYKLDVYSASMCATNSEETGDYFTTFSDGTGNGYVVLSDGMGSGKNASLESRMVVTMFKKLINSGVEHSSAIKLINSIMLTKSSDEAFATLDVIKINLDTAYLTIIKSGASATLIRHNNQVIKISSTTFPIGIVNEADTYSRNFEFDPNDIILMFSDGISENQYHYIKELLLCSNDLRFIVDEICRKARNYSETNVDDDITVIGMKLIEQ